MPTALVVDDEPVQLSALLEVAERLGFSAATARDLGEARRALASGHFDAVLLDVNLKDGSGLDLLLELPADRRPQVVLISGDDSVQSAFQALPLQEIQFLRKPVAVADLQRALRGIRRQAGAEGQQIEGGSSTILGRSGPIQRLRKLLRKVAPTDLSVYVEGESGTGKELVAQAIHEQSERREGPFLAINCGALPENLIDSELFGYEKGAFTGAEDRRAGVFEKANGGTLFLDEIAEMPPELQVRLLRALELQKVRRVGGSKEIPVDVRVVSATNRPFDQAIADGALREDLFHRLCVFPIATPPLRDRAGDIALLARHFLRQAVDPAPQPSRRLLAALEAYRWPGNVRQLKNAMQRVAVLAEGGLATSDLLPDQILAEVEDALVEPEEAAPEPQPPAAAETAPLPARTEPLGEGADETGNPAVPIEVGMSIADAERKLIEATLDEHAGDKKTTAEVLGVSLRTLYNRLADYTEDEIGNED